MKLPNHLLLKLALGAGAIALAGCSANPDRTDPPTTTTSLDPPGCCATTETEAEKPGCCATTPTATEKPGCCATTPTAVEKPGCCAPAAPTAPAVTEPATDPCPACGRG